MLFWSDWSFSRCTDAGNITLSLVFSGGKLIKTTLWIAFDTEYQYAAQKYPT